MISFWAKILCSKNDKLAVTLYRIIYQLDYSGEYHSQWLNSIRTTLQNLGLDDFWDGQFSFANMDNLKAMVDKRLKASHIQSWKNEIEQMSKCLNYRKRSISAKNIFQSCL